MDDAVQIILCPEKIKLYGGRKPKHILCMESHNWKQRTDEGMIIYKAGYHAGKWTLVSAPKVGRAQKEFVTWESVEFTRLHWVALRDVLWRKYQRKRCPWKLIEAIDKMLEDMPDDEE